MVPDMGAHHPVAESHMVLEPLAEVFGELARGFDAAGFDIGEEALDTAIRGIVLSLVPAEVGARCGAHHSLLVREMFGEGGRQWPGEFLNAGDLRARAHRLLELLRHAVEIAMLGVDFRKENGVRLRPLEMLHGRIVPDFGV